MNLKKRIMSIWVIMFAVMLLSFAVQQVLENKFRKYSEISNSGRMTGAEVAVRMLEYYGIHNVKVRETEGFLTDHFDPRSMTVNLSRAVYSSSSIAAAAVAAHECGHVVQHAQGYAPVRLRTALVPVVNFCNMTVQWVLLAGVLLINVFPMLIWVGIVLFAMTTLFSFVTLPCEINASQRAVAWLSNTGVVTDAERPMAVYALKCAAYTYVIAAIGSLATLFYYIGIASRRN